MSRQSPYTTNGLLSPLLAEETAKSEQSRLFHLITLVLPAPADPLNIVDSNYDVTYTSKGSTIPVVYTRFPVKFNGATVSSDGTIDKASISIANVSLEIMAQIELHNGLKNMRVLIKSVYENALDYVYTPHPNGTVTSVANSNKDNTAYIEDEYYVDTYQATEQVVVFQLDPIIDLEIKIPRRRFMADSCFFQFKQAHTCKYAGPDLTCDKTFDACSAKNNEVNFGGAPGVNGSRRILL